MSDTDFAKLIVDTTEAKTRAEAARDTLDRKIAAVATALQELGRALENRNWRNPLSVN